jgi:NADP-dependent 3-hydroxy acid dehydrogenase YdfG
MGTWFITGAARGLGYEMAHHALLAGENVAATARDIHQIERAFANRPELSKRLLPVALDITDQRQVTAAVEAVIAKFGSIDILINNAGRGLLGAVEEASVTEIKTVFETNVFGLLNVTRAILPHMRARRSGHIVNITSMGGFAQVAGWGIYGATKFAVEGLSEAMQAELAPLNIKVTIVEPGSFRTNFLDGSSLQATRTQIPDYDATVGQVRRAAAKNNGLQINDPAKGAAAIYAAVTASDPPTRLQIGPDAIKMVEAKLTRVRDELEMWREIGSSTLFDTTIDSANI